MLKSLDDQKIKIKEYIDFDNIIPLKIITVMKFDNELFALIEFVNVDNKKHEKGFFKTSLVKQIFPYLLANFYENHLATLREISGQ